MTTVSTGCEPPKPTSDLMRSPSSVSALAACALLGFRPIPSTRSLRRPSVMVCRAVAIPARLRCRVFAAFKKSDLLVLRGDLRFQLDCKGLERFVGLDKFAFPRFEAAGLLFEFPDALRHLVRRKRGLLALGVDNPRCGHYGAHLVIDL